jgi:hypothetical protein
VIRSTCSILNMFPAQDAEKLVAEGELKLSSLEEQSRKVATGSSAAGQVAVFREVERCRHNWNDLLSNIKQVNNGRHMLEGILSLLPIICC